MDERNKEREKEKKDEDCTTRLGSRGRDEMIIYLKGKECIRIIFSRNQHFKNQTRLRQGAGIRVLTNPDTVDIIKDVAPHACIFGREGMHASVRRVYVHLSRRERDSWREPQTLCYVRSSPRLLSSVFLLRSFFSFLLLLVRRPVFVPF